MTDDPMPVFPIKAKDNLAPSAVASYVYLLLEEGLTAQAAEAIAALEEIHEWRHRNPNACKWPDHEHVPAGQPGSGFELIDDAPLVRAEMADGPDELL